MKMPLILRAPLRTVPVVGQIQGPVQLVLMMVQFVGNNVVAFLVNR